MFHHVVTFLFLSLGVGLASIASSSCDSGSGGCQDDMALLQSAVSSHAFGQEGRTNPQALLLELASGTAEARAKTRALLAQLGGNLGTANGQGDLLDFGEQLVRMANATEHLDDTQEGLLAQVIILINQTMIPSIDEEHGINNQLLADKAADVTQCNTVLEISNSSGGGLWTHRGETEAARAGHLSCRVGELGDYNAKVTATAALYAHISAITPMHEDKTVFDAQWKTDKDVDAIANYFAGAQLYVNWFNAAKSAFEAKVLASQTANTTHSATKTACDGDQDDFENLYTLFKQAFSTSCTSHESCYNTENGAYATLLARLKSVEDNHHAAYKAAIIIMAKIQCLLASGTHSDCTDPTIEENRYLLTEPSVPSMSSCDQTEVTSTVCDGVFETHEYNALDINTPAKACP